MTLDLYILITCVKLLLIPSYFSTDFEVHRNWLATTYSLPLSQWYSAKHSEWTLDYPPLFAWFEYILSKLAVYVDKDMLSVNNLKYSSSDTIIFQRLSVIISDSVFFYGSHKCVQNIALIIPKHIKKQKLFNEDKNTIKIFLVANVTLLLLDHVHFQYNGFLFGILLISISHILKGENYWSAFWFSVLLNFKHIYLYLAPAYFIYLLKHFCLKQNTLTALRRLLKLTVIILIVFGISFGPFIWYGQLSQVLHQLFPFKRGLSHSYWAPNFWALYNTLDIGAKLACKNFGFLKKNETASMTGGLVKTFKHSILPSITPQTTFILTLVFILPCLWRLWNSKKCSIDFIQCLVLCGLTSFLFGWHVHEKAILLAVIPLTLLVDVSSCDCAVFTLLSTIATYSVFPLLFEPLEFPTKTLLFLVYVYFLYKRGKFNSLYSIERYYLISLGPLLLLTDIVIIFLGLKNRYPFLPLLLTSFHNSIGVFYCWLKYYFYNLYSNSNQSKYKDK
ncbi:probable dolichyl pyrophosphate Glc1Man9GlcNAc2 alpha-1,3-glucosyltransferase [Daktulosphaira vitifoliae]|uniref:probable dolichyl pyrophosphate Glc1Man9GlcNAc2 alpha-1,3-glucosyltransferase n=1 Tax=Daktulosphaira vitifoliae TaxID=58002 RepID=UPI0021A99417|nr:probable dolichyl pyrophosphate Glc1Man9GlcNAc2 alpha-1,3-glucosyltransferase [Daktulosphaira vitifoliae]